MSSLAGEKLMQIKVDRDLCCSYRACELCCPQIFKHDQDGVVYIEASLVPNAFEAQVRSAAKACPQGVITIIEN